MILEGIRLRKVNPLLEYPVAMPMVQHMDLVLREVDAAADELVDFAAALVRIPTVNPPGEAYMDCAQAIGSRLQECGFDVEYMAATGRPEHTRAHPRVNVIGRRQGRADQPLLHLNGHFDVVPPGSGWTVDPFGGIVRDGRLYGRGSADMKAGLAAAIYATEAVRRAGLDLAGTVEVSGTVDEESGGLAGVAWLAEQGRLGRTSSSFLNRSVWRGSVLATAVSTGSMLPPTAVPLMAVCRFLVRALSSRWATFWTRFATSSRHRSYSV